MKTYPVPTFTEAFEFLLHIDRALAGLTAAHGYAIYGILFAIIFLETGLIVTPFLPGDSLLFAAGALAATGALRFDMLLGLLLIAAITGDAVNYGAGRLLARRVLARDKLPFVNQRHLDRTQDFYRRYGAPVLVFGRFVPIVRTFAPFVAGVAAMPWRRFTLYNFAGAGAWVLIGLGAGYLWGELPFVKQNFGLVIVAVVFISTLPGLFGWLYERRKRPLNQLASQETQP